MGVQQSHNLGFRGVTLGSLEVELTGGSGWGTPGRRC